MRLSVLKRNINIALFAALGLNAAFWAGASDIYARWEGVPPVPSKEGAVIMGLGDAEFAYRFGAITLQSLGDGGGQVTPLKDYDYKKLGEWFWLLDGLDPASNHVPMLAAYYFGGTPVPRDVSVIVDYLGTVGQNPAGNKWRWLAHAVFLARHRMNDVELALDLAYKLSRMKPVGDTLPVWAHQMPAFVLAEKGDKAAAREIVENILLSSQHFHPNEVNFMKSYLIEQLGVSRADVDKLMKRRREDPNAANVPQPILPPPMP